MKLSLGYKVAAIKTTWIPELTEKLIALREQKVYGRM